MAMGVPVLASSTRIDRYYFGGGVIEFFDSGNIEDMAAKILDLMRNKEKREALRARGLEYVRTNNWDVKKNEYLSLSAALVSGQARDVEPDSIVPEGASTPTLPDGCK
jgi:glycosyltransferase involved in cell wall biosynthesis